MLYIYCTNNDYLSQEPDRSRRGTYIKEEKKIFFSPKIPTFLNACTTCPELPSNISTMIRIECIDPDP